MPDELTTTEAAAYLAAHGYTVHSKKTGADGTPAAELVKRWCIAGKLKGRKRENRWLISKCELDRLLDAIDSHNDSHSDQKVEKGE
jgi:hypothetical protein